MEWFLARNMSEVMQHLVPETCVQQMQYGMFNTADIQVRAASVSVALRPHPIALYFMINEGVRISGVEVAHFVPARTSPLRHYVYFTAVFAHAITKVERDFGPILYASKRWDRVAVCIIRIKCCWFEICKFWQQHGQCRSRYCMSTTIFVVHDGERFAPVALA